MSLLPLLLYSRKGCCLCEGLENHLNGLSLCNLSPSLDLSVIDIDHPDTAKDLRELYQYEVPVLVVIVGLGDHRRNVVLPRVSPRLKGEGLARWLQQESIKALGQN